MVRCRKWPLSGFGFEVICSGYKGAGITRLWKCIYRGSDIDWAIEADDPVCSILFLSYIIVFVEQ